MKISPFYDEKVTFYTRCPTCKRQYQSTEDLWEKTVIHNTVVEAKKFWCTTCEEYFLMIRG